MVLDVHVEVLDLAMSGESLSVCTGDDSVPLWGEHLQQ